MAEKLETPQGMGELLRIFRKERNLTQEMLASLAGVSVQSISNIELKNANYSIAVLCRLADALELSTDILLGRVPPKHRELDLRECAQILRDNGACIADWLERDDAPGPLRWMLQQYLEAAEKLLDYVMRM